MSDQKQTCSLLFISRDMEWLNAFQKGVQRFFFTQEKTADTLEEVENVLKDYRADLIVLSVDESLPSMDKVKQLLHRLGRHIPVLTVAPDWQSGSDAYVKLGAEFVSARRDLLTAIRAVQHVMRLHANEAAMIHAEHHLQGVEQRYQRLFDDLPDPICYLQDGLFLDANPAFLRLFKVKDKAALESLTIMSFVPLKSERNVKQLMKLAMEKDVVPSEKLEFHDNEDGKLELTVQVSQVKFRGEDAVQMYLRNASAGGGGGVDPTTGLGVGNILKASITQTQERSENQFLGVWIYLWLENYREVLQKDGYKPAEILMHSVAETAQRLLPPSTEMARFTDDALVLWIDGDKEQAITRVQNLVANLDELVPKNIGRLIHPHTFAGMQEVRKDSDYEDLIAKSFRAVRGLALGQGKDRVAEPAAADMSRKDERRLNMINKLLDNNQINFLYQPITMLEPDDVPRFATRINILATAEEMEEEMELDMMLQLADRYGLGRQLDRLKVRQFCQDVLSYDGDQRHLIGFLSLSNDALSDEEFPDWLANQLKQTGIAPQQIVLEISLDGATNAFSGLLRLAEKMRPLGARVAITEIARFDEEIKEIFGRIKPDVIKLDMREIDTFDEDEEPRFMEAIKGYAEEHHATLIVDHMESPAQLSRVWPYDLQILQGDGIVPPLANFNYDFSEAPI